MVSVEVLAALLGDGVKGLYLLEYCMTLLLKL